VDLPQDLRARRAANIGHLLSGFAASPAKREPEFTVSLLGEWHCAIWGGIDLRQHPGLSGVESGHGSIAGIARGDANLPDLVRFAHPRFPDLVTTPAADVAETLLASCRQLNEMLRQLDGQPPEDRSVESVIKLAVRVHCEIVRIHPYFDGNGSLARLGANWVLMRFGLPPVMSANRPDHTTYLKATKRCAHRQDALFTQLLTQLLLVATT
jgi:hypothetical protein